MTVLHQRPPDLPRSRACDALGLSRTGTYPRPPRPRSNQPAPQPRALSAAQRQAIRELMSTEAYQDDSVRVVHAKELNAGRLMASVSTIYRVLRATGETRERRAQRPPQRHVVPRITASAPNVAWSWDITKLPTTVPRVYLNLYVILDLFSRYPVGWMISRKENAALAKHLFEQVIAAYRIKRGQLTVHQDRGPPMIAHTYQDLLSDLGVQRSHSRPRVSNDNPFSESQFKTLKYAPSYPRRFADIEHARTWTAAFMLDYQHRPHEGLAFYTPADVFDGQVEAVHARRQSALDAHWRLHPERYAQGPPRASRPPETVSINPLGGVDADALLNSEAALTPAPDPVHLPKEMSI